MRKVNIRLLLKTFVATTLLFGNAFGQLYRTGLDFNDRGSVDVDRYESESFGFGEELPDSVSLRNFAPYPGNQGMYGTCVGWSFGYCGMTTLYARAFGLKNRNVITAMAMCPYTVYNNIKNEEDASCSQGSHLNLAGDFLTSTGTKRFHVHESDCNTTDEFDEALMIYKADGYGALWDWDPGGLVEESTEKVQLAKIALADGHVVLIGMSISDSFMNGVNEDGEWVKSEDPWENMPSGGHAMCVIGYNDKRFGGSFEIQNSWGQDWGDGGYAYVSYDDFQEFVRCAGAMQLDVDNNWVTVSQKKGCLFGDCQGEYSRFTYANGDSYEGLVKNGIAHGSGIYQWADGEVYAGQFENGFKHGIGNYYYTDGSMQSGHWVNDEFRPDLEYLDYHAGIVSMDGGYWEGYAKNKDWIFGEYYSDYMGKVYEGKFVDGGVPDDFGVLVEFLDEQLCQFKEGMMNGISVNYTGEYYTVNWCENDNCEEIDNAKLSKIVQQLSLPKEAVEDALADKPEGFRIGTVGGNYGHYNYGSGNNYIGFLSNGIRHGYGTYTFKEGPVLSYEGVYFNGERDGLGRIIFRDKSWFIGEFEGGVPNGKGCWSKADGTYQAGFWEDGKYVEGESGFGFADEEPLRADPDMKGYIKEPVANQPKRFANPVKLAQ